MYDPVFARLKHVDVEMLRQTHEAWFTIRIRTLWISTGGEVMADHCDVVVEENGETDVWSAVKSQLRLAADKL